MNKKVIVYRCKDVSKTSLAIKTIFENLGGIENIIKKGQRVLIKPNLVAPFEFAVTSSEVIEAVVLQVQKVGAIPIVAESSGFEFDTSSAIKILEIDKLCKRLDVEFINLDKGEFVDVETNNFPIKTFKISKLIFEVDAIINLPKLKGHALTKVTLGMKNLFGVIHKDTRRKIHAYNLEKGIYALSQIVKPTITIIDGLFSQELAVFSKPYYLGIIAGSFDVPSIDVVCSQIFGVDYKEVPHIQMGFENRNINEIDIQCFNCSVDEFKFTSPTPKNIKRQLKKFAYKLVYQLDIIYNRITKKTMLSKVHLLFGIRPFIVESKCTLCGDCVPVCKVNAISIIGGKCKIDYDQCMYVRCLKCIEVCKYNAIITKGLH